MCTTPFPNTHSNMFIQPYRCANFTSKCIISTRTAPCLCMHSLMRASEVTFVHGSTHKCTWNFVTLFTLSSHINKCMLHLCTGEKLGYLCFDGIHVIFLFLVQKKVIHQPWVQTIRPIIIMENH